MKDAPPDAGEHNQHLPEYEHCRISIRTHRALDLPLIIISMEKNSQKPGVRDGLPLFPTLTSWPRLSILPMGQMELESRDRQVPRSAGGRISPY